MKKMSMDEWKCLVCEHIYVKENGDPDNGIQPETKFGDLPDEWVCPNCGNNKVQYIEI